MKIDSKSVKAKDGRTIELICWNPPLDEELICQMNKLKMMWHPWNPSFNLRMSGKLINECSDRFITAFMENKLVGRMWYTVKGEFATYGHVITSEQCRGLGVAGSLLDFTLPFLDNEKDLIATYLGVSHPVPRAMYAKVGWQPLLDSTACIMRRFKNNSEIDDFDRNFFNGAAPFKVSNGTRGDLPRLEALYNLTLPDAAFSRNPLYAIYKGVAVEGQIEALLNDIDTDKAVLKILEDSRGHLVGTAFAKKSPAPCLHNIDLSFFIAPDSIHGADILLENILADQMVSNAQNAISSLSDIDQNEINILKRFGFTINSGIKKYFHINGTYIDSVVLLRKQSI